MRHARGIREADGLSRTPPEMRGRVEGILDRKTEGETIGDLKRSRQAILDLLEELGDIPEDIHSRILAEVDIEILRKWLKAAAKTTDFDAFRGKMI